MSRSHAITDAALFSVLITGLFPVALSCQPINVNDCDQFTDCAWYQPEGLACGLAHQSADHLGGSCNLEWDPALRATTESFGLESAGEAVEACPPGYDVYYLPDKGNEPEPVMATCLARGNQNESSGLLRDVPAGAACGLSRTLDPDGLTCEGAIPEEGECPPGWKLRWVPDRVADKLDEDCLTTIFADEPVSVEDWYGSLPMTFCQLDAESGFGADEYASSPSTYQERMAGKLCGLHWRFSAGLDTELLWMGPGVDHWEQVLARLQACIADAEGGELPPHLDGIEAHLESAWEEPPQCLGQEVTEAEPCPAELELTCAPNFVSEAEGPVAWICWCDLAESAQRLAFDE